MTTLMRWLRWSAGMALGAELAAVDVETRGAETFASPQMRVSELAAGSREGFARALLEETNRVRRAHGRKPLRAQSGLVAAADDQAAFMALRMQVAHGSLLPGQATPRERVLRHGVEALAVAENVASTPLGGTTQGLSVAEVAARLVAQWMESPGHRSNLLDRRLTHFGGAVRVTRLGEEWTAYGAQVFAIAAPRFGRVTRGGT